MKKMTAREITEAVQGRLLSGDPEQAFTEVSTDTRTIPQGALFFALRGERFDAHDFLEKALSGGAKGLIVSREFAGAGPDTPVILVQDTLVALQSLARYNRLRCGVPIVAVTGSNGKTTTKDMVTAVLANSYRVLKTEGNLNNEIGLPLTLLKMDETHESAVVEMGMSGLGEIDLLAGIARPTIGIITNIGESHLEQLGTVENIARAKGELLDHLPPDGLAILNGDDQRVRRQAPRSKARVLYYGTGPDAELRASGIAFSGEGTTFACEGMGIKETFYIPVPGEHNVLNALAAIAVARTLDVPVKDISGGLRHLQLTSMRLQVITAPRWTIINDAYNASPASAKAALEVLGEIGSNKRKIAVLGDMYELGGRTEAGHREVGGKAAETGVDFLLTVGSLARDIARGAVDAGMPAGRVRSVSSNDEGIIVLKEYLKEGDVVLVKGSRGVKMEEIVKSLSD